MFFGWEGVGVASYLLIGFYYRKPSANAAAIKAFVVNRVGDFGFALGIFALYFLVDSIRFDDIFAAAPDAGGNTADLPLDGMERGQPDRFPAVYRRNGQIGTIVPAHLAAGRDGRPNPGFGSDPRGNYGDGGRVSGLPHVAADGVCA